MRRASFYSRVALLGAAAVGLPGLFACLEHPLKPVHYDSFADVNETIDITVNRDVDVLFVIDNSGSMGEEQGTLAQNFGAFIDKLEEPQVDANYRLGITTTDNGNPWCSGTTPEGGALRLTSCKSRLEEFIFTGTDPHTNLQDEACNDICDYDSIEIQPTETDDDPTPKPRPWLESIEGATNLPDGMTTTEAFQCLGPQGINGCGFESHLESMYKGLKRAEDGGEPSHGFLRDDAILSVIFVTDEADCSYRIEHDSIFSPDGNRVFWSDPTADYPTSAVCWNAGVACTGSGTYDECHSVNKNTEGAEAGPSDGVLHPVERYVDLLQGFEDEKKQKIPGQEVIVSIIGGVPQGYGQGQEIIYQDASPGDTFGTDYGIGPGCSSAAGVAVPPVRLKEFAEAFEANGEQNMFSVCASDYQPALEATANAIIQQIVPACMPTCVADVDPTTERVEPLCALVQEMPTDNGVVEQKIDECVVDLTAGTWDFPGNANACYRMLVENSTATTLDDMSNECLDEGWNLEFKIERREGFPAPGGTSVKATCTRSPNASIDCPWL